MKVHLYLHHQKIEFERHYPRALIKKPKILLLDDCLSAVDTETEETILNALKANIQETTTLIVCHRVSSAKNANSILVLEDVVITQFGSHKQLLNSDGYYRELYNQQRLENKTEND